MKLYSLLLSISMAAANVAYCTPLEDAVTVLNKSEVSTSLQGTSKYKSDQKKLLKTEKELEKLKSKLITLESEPSSPRHLLTKPLQKLTGKTSAAKAEKMRNKIKELESTANRLRKEIDSFEKQHKEISQSINDVLQELYPVFIAYNGNLRTKDKRVKNLKTATNKLERLKTLVRNASHEDTHFKQKFVRLYADIAQAVGFIPTGPAVPARKVVQQADETRDSDRIIADIS